MMCAMVGERRGVRMRSRSGEWVEKCRTRREGSGGKGKSQRRAEKETYWDETIHWKGERR
jgi:hypothetical protein